ncbi:efflux RND transporter periplasmic adaptor subunit [Paenibacillus doosanensis]|uniref:Macrolide export protein MacA n=1 Tax=Paenibacillus konkukensis TaxID=2020716 RepID=A0ABY4RL18_9BACL|nr:MULTISPECIES: efflux RND transporter periplasmic adaptor subunit [Paenibacillus]MCS7463666.1 efflux RND transporter periplasmic adaptor subunit [Paenibacillus doosanensis]UQZ83191.1 Macrolide export protein MacA [Paenibacillus konkukensis]
MGLLRSKKWIAVIIGLALCGGGTYYYLDHKNTKKPAASTEAKTVEIKKGAITSTVSGTSQFEARDVQNIIAPVDGTIKTMNLTRNQQVKKGDVLFVISDLSLEANLQEAQVTLQQQEKDLADLNAQKNNLQIYAPISGLLTLTSNLDTGSNVNKNGRIGSIADNSTLKTKLPFLLEDAVQLKKGDAIDLTVDGFNLTKTAVVESVGQQPKGDASGNKLLDVEITVKNDGTLGSGMNVKGSVTLGGRKAQSTDKGTLEFNNEESILSGASGMISNINIKTGNYVNKGDLIASITNDTLDNDILNKQASIDRQKITINNYQDKLDQLTVTAPFDGIFSTDFANKKSNVLASYPAGSTIEANTQLGAVANLDYMQLPVQVDELDLPNVKVGMKASVKVDSISNKVYEGEVNQVSTVGTTTNGVTFFDVGISVKNDDQLRNGMTATAEIITQDKKDILLLPLEALQQQQGKRYVTLVNADGTKEEKHEIKIGIRNKLYVEVTDGLKEGDKVEIPVTKKSTTTSQADIDKIRQQFQQGGGFPGTGGAGGAGGVQFQRSGSTGGGGNR